MGRGRSTTATPGCCGRASMSWNGAQQRYTARLSRGPPPGTVRTLDYTSPTARNTTQDGLVVLTRPPPPAAWHGRCTTTRSDIHSLPTTLVWYDMAGECLPRPAETDRQLPPGTIATSGKCLLVSTIGPTTTINLLCDGGKVELLVPGCPGVVSSASTLCILLPHSFPRYRPPARIFTLKGSRAAAEMTWPILTSPSLPPVGTNLCRQ